MILITYPIASSINPERISCRFREIAVVNSQFVPAQVLRGHSVFLSEAVLLQKY